MGLAADWWRVKWELGSNPSNDTIHLPGKLHYQTSGSGGIGSARSFAQSQSACLSVRL
jgi:hypothetical protein